MVMEGEKRTGLWWKKGRVVITLVGLLSGGETCGHVKRDGVGSCERGCTTKVKHLWCYKSSCEVCYGAEIKRTCQRIVEKLLATEQLYEKIGEDLGGINSWIVSPPQEWAKKRMETAGGIRYMRQTLFAHLADAGCRGGKAVFHPYRVKDSGKDDFAVAKGNGYEGGIWPWLRDQGVDYLLSHIYISPHFHVFGFGYLKNSTVFSKITGGWFYKKTVGNLGREDLERMINYVLTHRGIINEPVIDGKYFDGTIPKKKVKKTTSLQQISEFGVLKNVSKLETHESETDLCEDCRGELKVMVDWIEKKRENEEIYDVYSERRFNDDGSFEFIAHLSDEPYIRWFRSVRYWLRSHPDIEVVFRCNDTADRRIEIIPNSDG